MTAIQLAPNGHVDIKALMAEVLLPTKFVGRRCYDESLPYSLRAKYYHRPDKLLTFLIESPITRSKKLRVARKFSARPKRKCTKRSVCNGCRPNCARDVTKLRWQRRTLYRS